MKAADLGCHGLYLVLLKRSVFFTARFDLVYFQ
jgi:hypothetical protein